MNQLLKEIDEIPAMAREFLKSSSDYSLPLDVPYIGMGSSYFAPLAFKYMGIDIHPEIASEYYNYVFDKEKHEIAVILSQSGESSESLWCRELFGNYIAITNDPRSSLAVHPHAKRTILLHAGDEKYSSTKTYINTLLALFKGFGFDPTKAVDLLNAVRTRSYPGGTYTLADFASVSAFQQAILDERSMEFLGEGIRNMDLLRTLSTIPGKPGATSPVAPSSPTYIWPIPTTELNINKLMTGN